MELDDVIDQMIAERVIHRHRRKWIAFFVVVLLAISLIWVLNGFDEPQKRTLETVQAPHGFELGRWEYNFESATITNEPKGKYTEAKSTVTLKVALKNLDSETKQSNSLSSGRLLLVPKKGKLIDSQGAKCRGQSSYKIVYGLPAEECTISFEVPPPFHETALRVAVLTEEFKSDTGISTSDKPYWHDGDAQIIVEFTATEVPAK